MKTGKSGTSFNRFLLIIFFFACFVSYAATAEVESHQVIDRLLSLSITGPGAPVIIENEVLFTFTSNCRRTGVAFAHEGFSKVHWFRLLLIPQDPLGAPIPEGKKVPDPYIDSGLLFHVLQLPEDLEELEYRLIIDGLWTIDPANPVIRRNSVSGLEYSVLSLPARKQKPELLRGQPGTLNFTFQGPPGETVTVAGSFNSWDPFMYELKEGPAGNYSLSLPVPPGKYQYIFFCKGERYLDAFNPIRVYSREGKTASEVILQ